MLHLYKSNSASHLFDALDRVLAVGQRAPFEFEWIGAPDGIHERLKIEIANRRGLFAGQMVTPRRLVENIANAVMPVSPVSHSNHAAYHPDAVLFFICKTILQRMNEPEFLPLANYLGESYSSKKLMALASALTSLFGEYIVYRTPLPEGWSDQTAPWQRVLFDLVTREFGPHFGEQAQDAIRLLGEQAHHAHGLPATMVVFGISSLPPLFLQVFAAASLHCDVHLFVVTPCLDYFAASFQGDRTELLNPLLRLLGRQAAMFQHALLALSAQVPVADHDLYDTQTPKTILGALQQGVLYNQKTDWQGKESSVPSIQFHQCSSIAREVDAVKAAVQTCIARDGISPADIVVLAPDINDYASFIEAAFADTDVPYTIGDRAVPSVPGAAEAIEALLSLPEGRLGIREVFSFLQMDPVRRAFSLEAEDVNDVYHLCRKVHIRSCIDADHRQELGLLPLHENTWQFGIERLMLGIAVEDDELFEGVVPVSVRGTEVQTLGYLIQFLESLFALVRQCKTHRTIPQWCALLEKQVRSFVNEQAAGRNSILLAIRTMALQAEAAGYTGSVEFAALRMLIKNRTTQGRFSSGQGQGVRFGSFRFMRGEAVKVMLLLGMNEDKFPGKVLSSSFDMIAAHPQPGDKDPRHDSYHMFLEALLAARERLCMFYTGDNGEGKLAKPCTPVRDLMSMVDAMVQHSGGRLQSNRYEIVHPGIAHAPIYFMENAPELVSYSYGDFLAAEAIAKAKSVSNESAVKPYATEMPLLSFCNAVDADKGTTRQQLTDDTDQDVTVLSLHDFLKFWKNPALYYLEQNLSLAFAAPKENPKEEEPFVLEGLDEWEVGRRCIDAILNGHGEDLAMSIIRGLGIVPSGTIGTVQVKKVYETALQIAQAVQQRGDVRKVSAEEGIDISIETPAGVLRLMGQLRLLNDAIFEYSFSNVKPSSLLHLALQQMVLQHHRRGMELTAGELVGRKDKKLHRCRISMKAVDSETLLGVVASYTLLGQKRALPFTPEIVTTYLEGQKKNAGTRQEDLLVQLLSSWERLLRNEAVPEARVLVDMGVLHKDGGLLHGLAVDVMALVNDAIEVGGRG